MMPEIETLSTTQNLVAIWSSVMEKYMQLVHLTQGLVLVSAHRLTIDMIRLIGWVPVFLMQLELARRSQESK